MDSDCTSALPIPLSCSGQIRAIISVSAADEIRDFPSTYSMTDLPLVHYPTLLEIHSSSFDFVTGSGTLTNPVSPPLFTLWPTGSLVSGGVSASTCSGWTSSTFGVFGAYGAQATTGGLWFADNDGNCGLTFGTLVCTCMDGATAPTGSPTNSPSMTPSMAPTDS